MKERRHMVQYLKPKTIEEAVSLLLEHEDTAKVIDGGTDLIVQLKKGEILPRYIVNIKDIPDQDIISYDEKEGLKIGTLATIRSIEVSPVIRRKFSVLAQAASQLGSWQVRNRATIGGNLCNAAPSAETAAALIVLGANLKIAGADGERTVPIENFFTGPGRTVLHPHEILAEIQVSNLPPRSGSAYIARNMRKALDLATVGVAVVATVNDDILSDVKIALGSVAPVPLRVKKAEVVIKGQKLNDALLSEAGLVAAGEASPIDDLRGSADYRRKMIQVLVKRAVMQAVECVKAV
ncbi:FAD binding domain-containing protein [Chloroflexota bacterium]